MAAMRIGAVGRRRRHDHRGSTTSAVAAHNALSITQTAAVRESPNAGTSQKAIASTPSVAPSVLLA